MAKPISLMTSRRTTYKFLKLPFHTQNVSFIKLGHLWIKQIVHEKTLKSPNSTSAKESEFIRVNVAGRLRGLPPAAKSFEANSIKN